MLASSVRNASDSTDLKAVFAEKYPVHGEEVKAFRRAHGEKKVGEITVDMVNISFDTSSHYGHYLRSTKVHMI